ncbi:MAG: phosphoglycerate kinase [Patescibacteria group bacterium]|nr:phosphoglycerate kinase [Patescibacteria group bacterium]
MRLKTFSKAKVKNKKVILRCGFDVPFSKKGKIEDDTRIKQSLPTIKYLIKNKAKVIIISHNGRPGGKYVKRLSMDEIGQKLSKFLRKKVKKLDDCVGSKVKEKVAKMKPGSVILLENLRFHQGEKNKDPKFIQALVDLGEIYINDAFANSHRDHASMFGITHYLPSYAGLLVKKEINFLQKFIKKPKKPFVAIVGGAKISSKLKAVVSLFKKTDALLLGGALANTILKAKGLQVGQSLIEDNMIKKVKKMKLTDIRLKIPVDVVVARGKKAYQRPVGGVDEQEKIYDIGQDTITLYKEIIKKAGQVVWAGPMGFFEDKRFQKGSYAIAQAISRSSAVSLVGGGDTLDVLNELNLKNKISHISTGGGAMLEFLTKGTLPALKPLIKK